MFLKPIFFLLFILNTNLVYAEWKMNPHTGKLDYYESTTNQSPKDATYITQTPNATLTNEQALSLLSTGLLKNTITTGILSIAIAGTDYENPLTFSAPLSRVTNTISIPQATASVDGFLDNTDWNTFNGKMAGTLLGDLATTAPITGAASDIFPGIDGNKATIGITIAKDIVAGVGLSGGEDNVLPGADADTTLTFAPAELESVTWGGGAQATIVHTFDVSGTDTTMTMGSAATTFSGSLAASNLSGSNTGDQTSVTGNAGTVTVADAGGDTSMNVGLWSDASGSLAGKTDAGLTFNANTNALTFLGDLINANAFTLYTTGPNDDIVIDANSGGAADIALGVTGDADTIHLFGTVTADGTVNATTFIGALTGTASGNLTSASIDTSAEVLAIVGDETGSASGTPLLVFNQAPTITNPVITNISPAADFTLTQNTNIIPFTSVNTGAVANTLYLITGNVGIGTTEPGAKLDVRGTISVQPGSTNVANITMYSGSYGLGMDSNDIVLWTPIGQGISFKNDANNGYNGTTLMRILGSGNVGIGTTVPGAKLEILPSSTAPSQGLYINFAGGPITMKSPDGTCGKCTLADDETLSCVSATCP